MIFYKNNRVDEIFDGVTFKIDGVTLKYDGVTLKYDGENNADDKLNEELSADDKINDKLNDKINDKLKLSLSVNEQLVFNAIKEDLGIKAINMAERFKISKSTVDRAIAGLKSKGLIKRDGSLKNGKWIIL